MATSAILMHVAIGRSLEQSHCIARAAEVYRRIIAREQRGRRVEWVP